MQELIQEAGYRLTVDSWENDGDANCTVHKTYKDRTNAYSIFTFFNTIKEQDLMNSVDQLTLKHCHIARKELMLILPQEALEEPTMTDEDLEKDTCLMSCIQDLLYEFGLTSEYFSIRYIEKVSLHYFSDPVYAEVIT